MSVFLSILEAAAVVVTSLVSIRDIFHCFKLRDWVVTSCLLTYDGNVVPSRCRHVLHRMQRGIVHGSAASRLESS
ncbi:hypothetical protein CTA2_11990 [Colletotrichum tanaceti]|uniref:Secreted protein n=1 Tax=Colletotrichum tanaceti TaxID=1306861 RepID=A0A4V6DF98_9PEZI|nr:hypothetical protein CTA2_11990 [Colletotrichum tanaceti]TKW48376.1 hypothetical protein CTA1_5425 [Colletotrichum tanaceti]